MLLSSPSFRVWGHSGWVHSSLSQPPIFQGLFFPAVKPPLLWSLHLLPESCKFMAGSAGPKFLSGASRAAPHAGQARQDLDLPRGLVPPVKDRRFPSLATQLIFGGSLSPSVTSVRAEPRGVVVGVARGWPPPSHPQGGLGLSFPTGQRAARALPPSPSVPRHLRQPFATLSVPRGEPG